MSVLVKPGWHKKKRDSLAHPNAIEMVYDFVVDGGTTLSVVADHMGVKMRGASPVFTEGDSSLDDFAWVLGDAMREYLRLRRSRIATPS